MGAFLYSTPVSSAQSPRFLPPLAPSARAAAALLALPALARWWRIQFLLPNTPISRPSTVRSTSSRGQCRLVPRGDGSMAASCGGVAWLLCIAVLAAFGYLIYAVELLFNLGGVSGVSHEVHFKVFAVAPNALR